MVKASLRVAIAILASSLLLTACGQRGPLFLPRAPAPPPATPAPPASDTSRAVPDDARK